VRAHAPPKMYILFSNYY